MTTIKNNHEDIDKQMVMLVMMRMTNWTDTSTQLLIIIINQIHLIFLLATLDNRILIYLSTTNHHFNIIVHFQVEEKKNKIAKWPNT